MDWIRLNHVIYFDVFSHHWKKLNDFSIKDANNFLQKNLEWFKKNERKPHKVICFKGKHSSPSPSDFHALSDLGIYRSVTGNSLAISMSL